MAVDRTYRRARSIVREGTSTPLSDAARSAATWQTVTERSEAASPGS